MLDLTGDGRSDALMTRDQQFLWFPCLGEKGFGPPQSIARSHDLDRFPDVFFDDPAGRVRLADMTGDGLNDIVTVHNGRIDYWPNLGCAASAAGSAWPMRRSWMSISIPDAYSLPT